MIKGYNEPIFKGLKKHSHDFSIEWPVQHPGHILSTNAHRYDESIYYVGKRIDILCTWGKKEPLKNPGGWVIWDLRRKAPQKKGTCSFEKIQLGDDNISSNETEEFNLDPPTPRVSLSFSVSSQARVPYHFSPRRSHVLPTRWKITTYDNKSGKSFPKTLHRATVPNINLQFRLIKFTYACK